MSYKRKREPENSWKEDERMEISRDDDVIENLWTTLPPEIVCMVFYWLPYEMIAQLAQEFEDCEPMYERLARRGYQWAIDAKGKWKALEWSPLSSLEEDFRRMVNYLRRELFFAFNCIEKWRMEAWRSGEVGDVAMMFSKDTYVKFGKALDQAERCHRDMKATVPIIQARYRDIQSL